MLEELSPSSAPGISSLSGDSSWLSIISELFLSGSDSISGTTASFYCYFFIKIEINLIIVVKNYKMTKSTNWTDVQEIHQKSQWLASSGAVPSKLLDHAFDSEHCSCDLSWCLSKLFHTIDGYKPRPTAGTSERPDSSSDLPLRAASV